MGWVMVMFDLPVTTDSERKLATGFRNFLLNDGYFMMQYSIYMRSCASYDKMKKHVERVKPQIPSGGNVKIIFITDKQWETSIGVAGETKLGKSAPPSKQPDLFEFW